jgi:hypothetical protein
LKPVSEFRSGRKGLICCAARGKPRIEKIFHFYLFVVDQTANEEAVPFVVSGEILISELTSIEDPDPQGSDETFCHS